MNIEGTRRCLLKVIPAQAWSDWRKPRKIPVTIVGFLFEYRTEYLRKVSEASSPEPPFRYRTELLIFEETSSRIKNPNSAALRLHTKLF